MYVCMGTSAHLAAGLRCAASTHRVLAGERPCPPQDALISFCSSCGDARRTVPKSHGVEVVVVCVCVVEVVCVGGVLSEHGGLWISHARAQSEEGLCGRRVVEGEVVNTQQPTFSTPDRRLTTSRRCCQKRSSQEHEHFL